MSKQIAMHLEWVTFKLTAKGRNRLSRLLFQHDLFKSYVFPLKLCYFLLAASSIRAPSSNPSFCEKFSFFIAKTSQHDEIAQRIAGLIFSESKSTLRQILKRFRHFIFELCCHVVFGTVCVYRDVKHFHGP